MKKIISIFVLIIWLRNCPAQVGIGTNNPNNNAVLEIAATNKGLLPPRLALTSTASPSPMSAHVAGMIVYNMATAGSGPVEVTPGFYFNSGNGWLRLALSSGNTAPVALNAKITGSGMAGQPLTASFSYADAEGDAQGTTIYQWYKAGDAGGSNMTPIGGATAATYTPTAADADRYIMVGITPAALTGASPGTTMYAAAPGGQILLCGTSKVTFTYNGASITVGTIASPASGVCYLDRNLGAPQAATSATDVNGYGDLFQWGRLADGHQLITWINSTTGTPQNGTTITTSSSDVPGNKLFITDASGFWRNPTNASLWQGSAGINNSCPPGWYVPTLIDWAGETGISNSATAYSQLKLTLAGMRSGTAGGALQGTGTTGYYYSSTAGTPAGTPTAYSFSFGPSSLNASAGAQNNGMSVRCRR